MKITAFSPVDAMYRHVTSDGIREVTAGGRTLLSIDAGALTHLAEQAFHNVSYFLRSSHLAQWRAILDDPEASHNDKFVAEALLRNAVISSEGYLPLCQDTGTATVVALRGSNILTDGDDAKHLEAGIRHAYERNDLRYSQIVPRSMFAEANSGNNLPPQIDIQLGPEDGYRFLFVAKGGGSSNKTTLIQGSKALLNDEALTSLLTERIAALGVAACPPYHLAVVIGGTSPEENLKVLKLASAHALDHLEGPSETGAMFRDRTWEEKVMAIAAASGLGAQFGGRYLALDARVIRLPRHAGSCPISIGVSCSAHRNILGHITRDGAFLEELEPDPVIYIAGPKEHRAGVHVEIGDSMDETVAALDGHAPGTLVYLSGTLVVARDMAHARLYEMLREGKPLPEYFKQWPVYYAGPAKTP
ncbi:fumarate hydratase, partial [Myxococcota bacterium]|nr:fumarate hydratase [Myxococcota bacterium]